MEIEGVRSLGEMINLHTRQEDGEAIHRIFIPSTPIVDESEQGNLLPTVTDMESIKSTPRRAPKIVLGAVIAIGLLVLVTTVLTQFDPSTVISMAIVRASKSDSHQHGIMRGDIPMIEPSTIEIGTPEHTPSDTPQEATTQSTPQTPPPTTLLTEAIETATTTVPITTDSETTNLTHLSPTKPMTSDAPTTAVSSPPNPSKEQTTPQNEPSPEPSTTVATEPIQTSDSRRGESPMNPVPTVGSTSVPVASTLPPISTETSLPFDYNDWLYHTRLDWLSLHSLRPFRERWEKESRQSSDPSVAPTSWVSAWDIRLVRLTDAYVRAWKTAQPGEWLEEIRSQIGLRHESVRKVYPAQDGEHDDGNADTLIERARRNNTASAYMRADSAYMSFHHTREPNPIFQIRSSKDPPDESHAPQTDANHADSVSARSGWRLLAYELSYETSPRASDSEWFKPVSGVHDHPRLTVLAHLIPPWRQSFGPRTDLTRFSGMQCQLFEAGTGQNDLSLNPLGPPIPVTVYAEDHIVWMSCPLPSVANGANNNSTFDLSRSAGLLRLYGGPLLAGGMLLPFASVATPSFQHALCVRPLESNLKPSQALQWLEWHAYIGVQHLYISDRPGAYEEAMQPLVDAGLASFHIWPAYHETHLYDRMHLIHACHMFIARATGKLNERSVAMYVDPDEYLVPLPCAFSKDAIQQPHAWTPFRDMQSASEGYAIPPTLVREYWQAVEKDGGSGAIVPSFNLVSPSQEFEYAWNEEEAIACGTEKDPPVRATDESSVPPSSSLPWSISLFPRRKSYAYGLGKPSMFLPGVTRLSVHRTSHKVDQVLNTQSAWHEAGSLGAKSVMIGPSDRCPKLEVEQNFRMISKPIDPTEIAGVKVAPLPTNAEGSAVVVDPNADPSCSIPRSSAMRIFHFKSLLEPERDEHIKQESRGGGDHLAIDTTHIHLLNRVESWLRGHPTYSTRRWSALQLHRMDEETKQWRRSSEQIKPDE